jgi:hypothetical protein
VRPRRFGRGRGRTSPMLRLELFFNLAVIALPPIAFWVSLKKVIDLMRGKRQDRDLAWLIGSLAIWLGPLAVFWVRDLICDGKRQASRREAVRVAQEIMNASESQLATLACPPVIPVAEVMDAIKRMRRECLPPRTLEGLPTPCSRESDAPSIHIECGNGTRFRVELERVPSGACGIHTPGYVLESIFVLRPRETEEPANCEDTRDPFPTRTQDERLAECERHRQWMRSAFPFDAGDRLTRLRRERKDDALP